MIQHLNSVFWPSDTESRINKLSFSDSVSLSFKTRLTCRLPAFAATLRKVNFKYGFRDGKHDDVTSRNVRTKVPAIFRD